eukprot:TRINITY_DN47521_c0_g1_i1.p1 TRINITY_DN47521_c0_g1~~TRINITY_DN47521_c0_g1_i1.p1  ORF type:complete len:211 (+),score=21.00 TRINITY_DN47521_c0_g1_i1:67-699(+)
MAPASRGIATASLEDKVLEASPTTTSRQREPHELLCPITHVMYRDPVMVPEAGRTYERTAILNFWRQSGRSVDPMSNRVLKSCEVFTNWDKRSEVQSFLDQHPEYKPEGWEDRTMLAAEVSEKVTAVSNLSPQESRPRIWGLLRCLTRILVSLVLAVLLCEALVLLWAHRQLIPARGMSSDAHQSANFVNFESWGWTTSTLQPLHRTIVT